MAKIADKYFQVDPWEIIESGFNKDYSTVAESVYSLGNEYMGVRGYFEEGYGGNTLLGSYFNGIYEQENQVGSSYKGVTDCTQFMVNSVDWLFTRIFIDGEKLDINACDIRDFTRRLDMRSGLLTRSFVWQTKQKKEIKLTFERFLSMEHSMIGVQKITMEALNFDGEIELCLGEDFGTVHKMYKTAYWECLGRGTTEHEIEMLGRTKNTKQLVYSSSKFEVDAESEEDISIGEQDVTKKFVLKLVKNQPKEAVRIAVNVSGKGKVAEQTDSFLEIGRLEKEKSRSFSYESLLKENQAWWQRVWNHSDIVIDGDEENQQGIRFCIFQMFQTYHGAKVGDNIGAKGLTGEAYNGNAFWDTETYCLPFFLFNDIKAAKNLLLFRSMTLPEAKERAKALDCEGAFYPIATISGKECCNLWQHASLQLQASTAVAYGIWLYEKITKDREFLESDGVFMLVEICRMLATRGDWSADKSRYGYYGVMGPDEFQMMVNNNCYTNYMGRFTLNYTEEVLDKLQRENAALYQRIVEEMRFTYAEREEWKKIAKAMYIPKDEEKKLYEQHEGFFNLPHVEVDDIPTEEFPLYSHWTYDRIYRNDMIKQPDVLMLMLLFNHDFTEEELRANYEYYEPKCIHESSLSPSVHSILASQLKKHDEAYRFFGFATRMDLDNYNRNSGEGIHTTSIAAAWMNIVYGFGGMRSDAKVLEFHPSIPTKWQGYSFRIGYEDNVIVVTVKKDTVEFYTMKDKEIAVKIYGEDYVLSQAPLTITIPQEWRG